MNGILSVSLAVARAALVALAVGGAASAQDMMQYVDLNSPQMTEADMTRDEVLAVLSAASSAGAPADLTGRKLSGLDLAGVDFSGANLRGAYLNKTKLAGANFDGAILDQAWA